MSVEQKVINYYIVLVERCCNKGGYSKLSKLETREELKKSALGFFKGNGYDNDRILKILDTCNVTTIGFFDELFARGVRIWTGEDFSKEGLRGRLNIALQSA